MGTPLPSSNPPAPRPGAAAVVPPAAAPSPWRPLPPARTALNVAILLAPVALLALLAYLVMDLSSQMPPGVAPRHRAEAVCFSLAEPDPATQLVFAPPMRVEPSAALLTGRFAPGTPAGIALRQVMGLDESMVIDESQRAVGDYTVSVVWLSLQPGAAAGTLRRAPVEGSVNATDAGHWLVLTWMEGSDLAVCNFHFADDPGAPGVPHEWSPIERRWGERLVDRVLVADNFRAGSLPHVTLRATRGGATMPVFGPESR